MKALQQLKQAAAVSLADVSAWASHVLARLASFTYHKGWRKTTRVLDRSVMIACNVYWWSRRYGA